MRVLNDFVLLRQIGVAEEVTDGGILIPEQHQVKPHIGVVVSVGPNVDLKKGEKVLYSKFADEAVVELNDETLILVRFDEIRLVL